MIDEINRLIALWTEKRDIAIIAHRNLWESGRAIPSDLQGQLNQATSVVDILERIRRIGNG